MKISRQFTRYASLALLAALAAGSTTTFADTFHFGEGDSSVGSAGASTHSTRKPVRHKKPQSNNSTAAKKTDVQQ